MGGGGVWNLKNGPNTETKIGSAPSGLGMRFASKKGSVEGRQYRPRILFNFI